MPAQADYCVLTSDYAPLGCSDNQIDSRRDPPQKKTQSVGRLGGNEFALIVPDLPEYATDTRTILHTVESLIRVLTPPIFVGGHELTLSISAGIAVFPMDNTNGNDLFTKAELAMQQAKQSGKKPIPRANLNESAPTSPP